MVLLKTPTISKAAEGVCGKLNLIYTGPFKITNLPFINVAELTDITGKRKGKATTGYWYVFRLSVRIASFLVW